MAAAKKSDLEAKENPPIWSADSKKIATVHLTRDEVASYV